MSERPTECERIWKIEENMCLIERRKICVIKDRQYWHLGDTFNDFMEGLLVWEREGTDDRGSVVERNGFLLCICKMELVSYVNVTIISLNKATTLEYLRYFEAYWLGNQRKKNVWYDHVKVENQFTT